MIRILYLYLVFCLLSCNKGTVEPEHDNQEYYFKGYLGVNSYAVVNDLTRRVIRTVPTSSTDEYEFIFEISTDIEQSGNRNIHQVLEVSLLNIVKGKTYRFVNPKNEKDRFASWIYSSTTISNEIEKTLYTAPSDRSTVIVSINEVTPDNKTGVPVISGFIKGHLFNAENLADSIRIDAEFRTKAYVD